MSGLTVEHVPPHTKYLLKVPSRLALDMHQHPKDSVASTFVIRVKDHGRSSIARGISLKKVREATVDRQETGHAGGKKAFFQGARKRGPSLHWISGKNVENSRLTNGASR